MATVGAVRCTVCAMMPADTVWYHGTSALLSEGQLLLPPAESGQPFRHPPSTDTRAAERKDFVYVTPDPEVAKIFVGLGGGYVYRVRPIGAISDVPWYPWANPLGLPEYLCRRARVLSRVPVSGTESWETFMKASMARLIEPLRRMGDVEEARRCEQVLLDLRPSA